MGVYHSIIKGISRFGMILTFFLVTPVRNGCILIAFLTNLRDSAALLVAEFYERSVYECDFNSNVISSCACL